MTALLVVLAGGAGAALRFAVDDAVSSRLRLTWPVATLLVNVSGSLLLGLLAGAALSHSLGSATRAVVGTGFCGGYTTFSTASVEVLRLAERRRRGAATAYAVGSLLLSVLAAGLGLAVTLR